MPHVVVDAISSTSHARSAATRARSLTPNSLQQPPISGPTNAWTPPRRPGRRPRRPGRRRRRRAHATRREPPPDRPSGADQHHRRAVAGPHPQHDVGAIGDGDVTGPPDRPPPGSVDGRRHRRRGPRPASPRADRPGRVASRPAPSDSTSVRWKSPSARVEVTTRTTTSRRSAQLQSGSPQEAGDVEVVVVVTGVGTIVGLVFGEQFADAGRRLGGRSNRPGTRRGGRTRPR